MSREETLNLVEDKHCRNLLAELFRSLELKTNKIRCLEDKVEVLETQVAEQEKYSSKDCIIIENMPINRSNEPLSHQVCRFLQTHMDHQTTPASFKACHFLGKWKNDRFPPAIIIKFIYFGEKDAIYSRKSMLARLVNQNNQKPIFLKERLPEQQRKLKTKAEEMGYITTTSNCTVKLFQRSLEGKFSSFAVKYEKELEDARSYAVLKRPQALNRINRQPEGASHSRRWERQPNVLQQQSSFRRSHLRSERRSENSMDCDELSDVRRLHKDTNTKVVNTLKDAGETEQRRDKSTGTTVVCNNSRSSAVETNSNRPSEKKPEQSERLTNDKGTFATPNSAKSFLKRLRESPQDDEQDVNLLNQFLQNAKNMKTKDPGECDSTREPGELSDRESDGNGEIDQF